MDICAKCQIKAKYACIGCRDPLVCMLWTNGLIFDALSHSLFYCDAAVFLSRFPDLKLVVASL